MTGADQIHYLDRREVVLSALQAVAAEHGTDALHADFDRWCSGSLALLHCGRQNGRGLRGVHAYDVTVEGVRYFVLHDHTSTLGDPFHPGDTIAAIKWRAPDEAGRTRAEDLPSNVWPHQLMGELSMPANPKRRIDELAPTLDREPAPGVDLGAAPVTLYKLDEKHVIQSTTFTRTRGFVLAGSAEDALRAIPQQRWDVVYQAVEMGGTFDDAAIATLQRVGMLIDQAPAMGDDRPTPASACPSRFHRHQPSEETP